MIVYAGKRWRVMMQYRTGHKKFEVSLDEMISRTERRGYYRVGEAEELLRLNKEIRTPKLVFTLEEIKDKPGKRPARAAGPARGPRKKEQPAEIRGQTRL